MPIPLERHDDRPPVTRQLVVFEPVFSLLYSMMLLGKQADHIPGVSDWVLRTKDAMSLEERQKNRLVMSGLFYAFLPDPGWQSFVGFIDHLAALDPVVFQDRLLAAYARFTCDDIDFQETGQQTIANKEIILETPETYLAFLDERFGAGSIDTELESQAYRYVIDPPTMQTLIVNHFRHMWEKYLSPEWARVRSMLRESVKAFQQVDMSAMSRAEAFPFITSREIPTPRWEKWIEQTPKLIFTPNAHSGPYLGKIFAGNTLGIVFGARLPEGASTKVPDLDRTEIITRLSALTDDNRLEILRLAVEKGEIRAQDVMQSLDMCQSTASRHLTQLTATGYLFERRYDGNKCYSLNPKRVEDTLQAISGFLLKK